jgi:hypothetical protein
MGLVTTVNIKDRKGVIQEMRMMMMIFRDVAQSAVNNMKPKHKTIFDSTRIENGAD